MIPLDRLEKLLHQHGQRLTNPRRVIFEFFALAREPIQLADILTALRPLIDRASIYRNVELFLKLGIIQEVHRPGRLWLELGDDFRGHHHHITCTACGRSQTLASPALEASLAELGRQAGFAVTAHHIELTGHCEDCRDATRHS